MRDFSANPHKLYPGSPILWSWVFTIHIGSHTLSYPVHKQELDGGCLGNQLSWIWITSQHLTLKLLTGTRLFFGWWLLPFLATEEVRASHIASLGKGASSPSMHCRASRQLCSSTFERQWDKSGAQSGREQVYEDGIGNLSSISVSPRSGFSRSISLFGWKCYKFWALLPKTNFKLWAIHVTII